MKKLEKFWQNKRVFITGHTGFKGSWLVLCLLHLGAEICGYSTDSSMRESIFKSNKKRFINNMAHIVGDIQDYSSLRQAIADFQPDIIFHLAAQPLVLESIEKPLETWKINLIGTNILLEAIKSIKKKCAIIIVTTDKVYENNELAKAFSENDRLGGYDPYSASKSCVEIACKSWYYTYINKGSTSKFEHLSLSTVRAGNVIGGGDWSKNRLIPDCIRAAGNDTIVNIRNPSSTRPWQHVLDCLYGYILLAEYKYNIDSFTFDSFNFGPPQSSNKNVLEVVEEVRKNIPTLQYQIQESNTNQESNLLYLNSSKSQVLLNWSNLYAFEDAVAKTISWYQNAEKSCETYEISQEHVRSYFSLT